MLFSGYTLLRDPHFNKGLAFTEDERDAHYLRGLLPPSVIPQETQVNYLTRKFSEYFNFYYFPKLLDCACAYTLHWAGEENDPARTPVSSSIAEVYGNDGSSGVAFCTIIF